MPEQIDECVESILRENPDMDESRARAICQDMANKGQLEDALAEADCPAGHVAIDGDCKPIEEVSDVPPSALGMADAPLRTLANLSTDPIERVDEGDDTVRYRNVKILSAGVWTDSESREQIWYSPRGLRNLEVTGDNVVNIMHDDDNEVAAAGRIDPESTTVEDGDLIADILIDTSSAAGQFADENLQQTLETQGAKGFGGPSVEIAPEGQDVKFNDQKGLPELRAGRITGLGLVKHPASKPTSFAKQAADRGVALADGSQSTILLDRQPIAMADHRLQVDTEALIDYVATTTDDTTVSELSDALGEGDEVPEALANAGVQEITAATDDEGDDEDDDPEAPDEDPEDDEEGEEDEQAPDLEDRLDALEERVQNAEDMMESLMQAEDVSAAIEEELSEAREELADAETVAQLSKARDELERRLEDLESTPQYRTMAEGDDEDDEFDGDVSPMPVHRGGTTRQ